MKRSERLAVYQDFMARHGNVYRPDVFLAEVKADPQHPARGCFQLDVEKAGHLYQLQQARQFVSDLRVECTQDVRDGGEMRVVMMPVAVSEGGGIYVSTLTARGQDLLAGEALQRLHEWHERYAAVVNLRGERAYETLELAVARAQKDEAA